MAVQDGYGKSSGSESLVFAYDLKDTVNSFRGEPATNSQNADISSMTQVGFDNWGCYDGVPPYHTWGVNQSKTFVNIPGPFGSNVNAMLYHNFNGGFYGPTDWGAIPGGTITAGRTYTVQGWVKAADSSSIGKTVNAHTYYTHSAGAYSDGTNYTLTDQWQLVSHTHTVQYTATGGGIMYFFTQNTGAVKMYLTMTGVFLDKTHAVQWLVGGSTRSATQGLLDLTGNRTINVSDVSFTSNGIMTFDGTNDVISIPTNSVFNTNNFSVESIFKLGTYDNQHRTIASRNASVYSHSNGWWMGTLRNGLGNNNNDFRVFFWGDSSYVVYNTSSGGNDGRYHHMVISCDGVTVFFYVDGQLTYSASKPSGNLYSSSENVLIGQSPVGDNWSGDIPIVKFYNRSLSSTEITNNYLKYKRQYGLT